ncbi:MAG TPA: hypothetical protein DDX84_10175 [Nitrospiraceae bacterium]|nr:hypothetical protein [Nitrospiraceae bacterium]
MTQRTGSDRIGVAWTYHIAGMPKDRSAWGSACIERSEKRLIRKIYEVDPLLCPRCLHPMKIVAFIGEDFAIQKILMHMGLWETRTHSQPPSCEYEDTIYADKPTPSLCM